MLFRCSPQPGLEGGETPREEGEEGLSAPGGVVITPGTPPTGSAVELNGTVVTTGTLSTTGPDEVVGGDVTSTGSVVVDTSIEVVGCISRRAGMVILPLNSSPATGDHACSNKTVEIAVRCILEQAYCTICQAAAVSKALNSTCIALNADQHVTSHADVNVIHSNMASVCNATHCIDMKLDRAYGSHHNIDFNRSMVSA